jgi:hypothetical protein
LLAKALQNTGRIQDFDVHKREDAHHLFAATLAHQQGASVRTPGADGGGKFNAPDVAPRLRALHAPFGDYAAVQACGPHHPKVGFGKGLQVNDPEGVARGYPVIQGNAGARSVQGDGVGVLRETSSAGAEGNDTDRDFEQEPFRASSFWFTHPKGDIGISETYVSLG